ncbi:hypothetical protein QJS10_CPA06g01204 [Acorus calamus]|uniref:Uncharacterized protein n=1 Tax=Acorus calamus TaxID=4465 RepID=A0AAV9EN86_ACOCL|nr:hypothetical protein QJS10_CPA06g01204 [Acorus calamus]
MDSTGSQDDRFIHGGVTCKFTKGEVTLITSLPFHRKALDLHSKKISDIHLLQKHFPSKHLNRKDVREKLIQLYPSKDEEDKRDFKQIASGDPSAGPSSPSMPDQEISPLSERDMEISETLAMVEKVVEDSTFVVLKKKKDKKTITIVKDTQVEDSQVQVFL